ncbi:hypothetical protein THAOC_01982, partial [Thalassiosira oceanica]
MFERARIHSEELLAVAGAIGRLANLADAIAAAVFGRLVPAESVVGAVAHRASVAVNVDAVSVTLAGNREVVYDCSLAAQTGRSSSNERFKNSRRAGLPVRLGGALPEHPLGVPRRGPHDEVRVLRGGIALLPRDDPRVVPQCHHVERPPRPGGDEHGTVECQLHPVPRLPRVARRTDEGPGRRVPGPVGVGARGLVDLDERGEVAGSFVQAKLEAGDNDGLDGVDVEHDPLGYPAGAVAQFRAEVERAAVGTVRLAGLADAVAAARPLYGLVGAPPVRAALVGRTADAVVAVAVRLADELGDLAGGLHALSHRRDDVVHPLGDAAGVRRHRPLKFGVDPVRDVSPVAAGPVAAEGVLDVIDVAVALVAVPHDGCAVRKGELRRALVGAEDVLLAARVDEGAVPALARLVVRVAGPEGAALTDLVRHDEYVPELRADLKAREAAGRPAETGEDDEVIGDEENTARREETRTHDAAGAGERALPEERVVHVHRGIQVVPLVPASLRRVGLVVVQVRERDVRDGDPRVDLALVDGTRRAEEEVDVAVGLGEVPATGDVDEVLVYFNVYVDLVGPPFVRGILYMRRSRGFVVRGVHPPRVGRGRRRQAPVRRHAPEEGRQRPPGVLMRVVVVRVVVRVPVVRVPVGVVPVGMIVRVLVAGRARLEPPPPAVPAPASGVEEQARPPRVVAGLADLEPARVRIGRCGLLHTVDGLRALRAALALCDARRPDPAPGVGHGARPVGVR